ncbi:MAG: SBBP repeat-containing protein [Promethearchaeota archaeon]
MKLSYKNRKNGNIVFLFLLYLCFILPLSEMLSYKNKNKNNTTNLTTLPYTSTTNVYEWFEIWGGSGYDRGYKIAVDGSENIFITGETSSFGDDSGDVFILKYKSNGTYLWNETWGGSYSEYPCGIAVNGSGNVFITGYTYSYGANAVLFLLKYDSDGNELGSIIWGGLEPSGGLGLVLNDSGDIFITGFTDDDVLLIKCDSAGNEIWNATWEGSGEDMGIGIALDGSGNIFITGYTDDDVLLIKCDSSGNEIWNATWGGSGSEYGRGIVVDGSGNAFITGETDSFGASNTDLFLLKYDSSGNLLWNTTFGGNNDNGGDGIVIDDSGNIIITGYTFNDLLLIKYDSDGNELWSTIWDDCYGHGLTLDDSGNIFIVGETIYYGADRVDVVLLKYGVDTDEDGLSDDSEVNIHGTDPNDSDSDDDGLNDGSEINTHGTDPNDSDSEDDNMPDGWEVLNDLDPLVNDSYGDPDSDDLSNLEEYQNNTDPNDEDSDDDGLNDGSEVNTHGTDPNDSDSDDDGLNDGNEVNTHGTDPNDSDSDDDGLNDGSEINTHGTDPNDSDSEDDNMPDGWEVLNDLDPLVNDSYGDPDSDDLSNLEEYQNNTDPNDEDSDDDGLNDGSEVNTHGTDPNDEDTDGDGYNDKEEIDNGTDPLDSDDPPDDGEGAIPGYEVLALIGILSLTTGIIFRKRFK